MNDHSDPDLNRMLGGLDPELSATRLHRVRHSILTRVSAQPRRSFFVRSQPAFLLATALLGLVLGASVPLLGSYGSALSYLDYSPQNFLNGDYG